MRYFQWFFFVLSVLFLSPSGFADHETQAKPYLGSTWEEQGLLPYEICHIVSEGTDGVVSAGTLGLGIVGVSPFNDFQNFYLSCETGDGDYAFTIPIGLSEMYYVGIIAELSRLGMTTFTVNNLHQKTVQDVYGTYHGFAGGLTLGVGGRGGVAWGFDSKVRIKFTTINMLVGVSSTYVGFSIRSVSPAARLYFPKHKESLIQYLEGVDHFKFVRVKKDGTPKYSI